MHRNTITAVFPMLLLLLSIASSAWGFTASQNHHRLIVTPPSSSSTTRHAASSTGGDPSEIIARKITVCGDVDGGYYRACVKNEVGCILCHDVMCSIVYCCMLCADSIIHSMSSSFIPSLTIICFYSIFCWYIKGSRFRKLIGTMTPPDDSEKAEILVEVS